MPHSLTRLAVTAVAVMGTALAAGPATASTARPAMAAGNIFIFCEASGSYCQRDANNASAAGNPIVEAGHDFGSATESSWHETSGSFTVAGVSYPNGVLEYDQHPGWCDGLDGSYLYVQLEPCNGSGTAWGITTRNGADVFVSRLASQTDNKLEVLSAGGTSGDELFVDPDLSPGILQRWNHLHD